MLLWALLGVAAKCSIALELVAAICSLVCCASWSWRELWFARVGLSSLACYLWLTCGALFGVAFVCWRIVVLSCWGFVCLVWVRLPPHTLSVLFCQGCRFGVLVMICGWVCWGFVCLGEVLSPCPDCMLHIGYSAGLIRLASLSASDDMRMVSHGCLA
jgi:hypothetical protein